GNPLYFQSAQNVTVNILNEKSKVLTRLVTGKAKKYLRKRKGEPKGHDDDESISPWNNHQSQSSGSLQPKFQVLTTSGKLLFSADDNEVVVGAERLKVLGKQYSSELLLLSAY
ncbi:hypothetical protein E2320_015350, partial [Naja naja]